MATISVVVCGRLPPKGGGSGPPLSPPPPTIGLKLLFRVLAILLISVISGTLLLLPGCDERFFFAEWDFLPITALLLLVEDGAIAE